MKHSQIALIASAVASLLSSAACRSDDSGAKGGASKQTGSLVRCEGINTCKGTSECQSEHSACAGHNECKGMGFITVPADQCKEKGGKNLDEEA